jgi:ribonuclease HI
VGGFDEASKGHPSMCGVGVVLCLNQTHYIHIRYAPGPGTNNRAEFIGLWALLEAAKDKDIKKM